MAIENNVGDISFIKDIPLQKHSAFLIGRYYAEALSLITLCGVIYAALVLSGKASGLVEMGKICMRHVIPISAITLGVLGGIPLLLYSFPQRQKGIWACSEIPLVLRISALSLRFLFSVVLDICLLPIATVLFLVAKVWKSNFDPNDDEVKKDKIPILLLHGNDSNESEWVVGRLFLNNKNYGSVFTLNYDTIFRHDHSKGPDDYANGKVQEKINHILKVTNQSHVIIIGHSMGGLIAANCAKNNPSQVKKIISIATPWQGAPVLKGAIHFPCTGTKRFRQMYPESDYLKDLNRVVSNSIQDKEHAYYNIYSTVDVCVPNHTGIADGVVEKRTKEFTYIGHLGIVIWPETWLQIRKWLNEIYAQTESAAILAPV